MQLGKLTRRTRAASLVVAGAGLFVLGGVTGAIAGDRFADVSTGATHVDGIGFMADSGVTVGCGDNRFCPSDPVTRAQMATFMHRLSGTVPDTDPSVNAAALAGVAGDELLAELEALRVDVDELTALLAGVGRLQVEGRDTLQFTGVNLQIVDGSGTTAGPPTGLGNLIVGYNEQRPSPATRTGSHTLVVGPRHEWTGVGGIVAGANNNVTGNNATVAAGLFNTASGPQSIVTGGQNNTASGTNTAVLGGLLSSADAISSCHPGC